MAARRCSLCDINYPAIAQFETCPVHDEPTELHTSLTPTTGWQDRMKALKSKVEEAARPIPRAAGVTAICDGGLLWVTQEALYRAGVRISSVGPSFRLFELDDGWVYETQGWDESHRRWWVERVATAVALPTPDEVAQIAK